MDRIVMKNLAFFGYHGAMSEENVLGQKFFLDLTLFVDLKKAGTSDSVEDTVHYGEAYNVVKNIVEKEKFMLIEKLAQHICEELLKNFWFPLTDNVSLNVGGFQLANLKSCMLTGRQFLLSGNDSEEEKRSNEEKFTISSENETLFFVLPQD